MSPLLLIHFMRFMNGSYTMATRKEVDQLKAKIAELERDKHRRS
jgi:hypothetical protein